MSRLLTRSGMAHILAGMFLLVFMTMVSHAAPPARTHHTEDGFRNIYAFERPGMSNFLKWRLERMGKDHPSQEDYLFPLADNNPAFLRGNREMNTLTWVGHSTLFVQLRGQNILTDPHFSRRASPVSWAGPERVTPPGIALKDLPPVDIVLISHDHYDHLDRETIVNLHRREGGEDTLFLVPLKLKSWFEDLGVRNVVEMDWWEEYDAKGLRMICTPMHHWSKRTLFAENETLWAGWAVDTGEFRFIFLGDCGYSPIYRDIGDELGPFDLAAIPIGAYEPRWFMRNQHVNPAEAVQVHLDLRARRSVGIHWGTFILTDEPLDEPPLSLMLARERRNLPPEDFFILRHGETIVLE